MNSTWTIILSVLASVGLLFVSVMFKVFAHLVSEEVEGRLDQIGYAILRLACKQLPAELREDYYQVWAAELDAHFLDATDRPLTRLYWSLRFPTSLLFRARSFARIQDPAAVRSRVYALADFLFTSRPVRIATMGTHAGSSLLLLVTNPILLPGPLIFTVILFFVNASVLLLFVFALLCELADVLEERRGSRPSWGSYLDTALDWSVLLLEKAVTALLVHLYELRSRKPRQVKAHARIS